MTKSMEDLDDLIAALANSNNSTEAAIGDHLYNALLMLPDAERRDHALTLAATILNVSDTLREWAAS